MLREIWPFINYLPYWSFNWNGRQTIRDEIKSYILASAGRFEMSPDWGWVKNQAVVLYPEDNLELECSSQARYKLYSVINHQGSLDDGHYTVFCRHSKPKSAPWWFCDDEKIQCPDKELFHSNSNAYLLFYALQTNTVSTFVWWRNLDLTQWNCMSLARHRSGNHFYCFVIP